MNRAPHVVVHPDADVLAEATAARLLTRLVDLQSDHSPVHVVLTGGTVGIAVLRAVAASPVRGAVDWSDVHVWWGDERFLPDGDPDRNEVQAREALLDALGDALPADHVHAMPARTAQVPDTDAAARLYAAELARHAPADAALAVPSFDVLLLGMGPDGHVASLFPGHATLSVSDRTVVGEEDSPKPPPPRVSLTFPAIQAAAEVWVVAAGDGKADAVAAALRGAPATEVPAAGAVGVARTLWLLDVAAASHVTVDPGDTPVHPARPAADGPGSTWAEVDDLVAPLLGDLTVPDGIAKAAATAALPEIAVTAPQGRLLELLARATGSRRVLELGTLGGYSTWWLARGAGPEGIVVSLELSADHAAVARHSLDATDIGHRVQIEVGPAASTLQRMIDDGTEPFDLVFVDADKQSLARYLELVVALSRPGTVIVVDNVVRGGAVLEADHPDDRVQGTRQFLERAAQRADVEGTVIQTVGRKGYDGMAILVVR
ncbi:MAG: 6-phosphogluconolactonase [Cellulomonas sp. 73-145]|uniref:6-phosphogluconolactonase n=1 Tax=Cellulomonas sp. 73-145 TaxID=1895739 RepID=UPI0009270274|nr:MAG: 6-phosphogluconolactonase [Cellulomonas sp. 73-145]